MKLTTAGIIVGLCFICLALVLSYVLPNKSEKTVPETQPTESATSTTTPEIPATTTPSNNQETQQSQNTQGNESNQQTSIYKDNNNVVQLKEIPEFDSNFEDLLGELVDSRILLNGYLIQYVLTVKFEYDNKVIYADIITDRVGFRSAAEVKTLKLTGGYTHYGDQYAVEIYSWALV